MTDDRIKTVVYYKQNIDDNSSPFNNFISSIKDRNIKRAIYERIKRLERGHYGHHRNLKGGIFELKFDNGLRIYCAEIGATVIVILCGGGKNTKREQDKDIAKAREYLRVFIGRLKE